MGNKKTVTDAKSGLALTTKLLKLVMKQADNFPVFLKELAGLIGTYGDNTYSELLHILTHLNFSGSESHHHWMAILKHRDEMASALKKPVDFRVAMADYFIDLNRKMRHPKMIEIQVYERTAASSITDELTGLYNYRFFMASLKRELNKVQRLVSNLSIILMDIDNFKQFNDTFGHLAGNKILSKLGKIISFEVRDMDIPCRYGGEEFAIILPHTDKFGARILSERMRVSVASAKLPGGRNITISAGISSYPSDGSDPQQLVERADQALYQAKALGKNQTFLYSMERRAAERCDTSLQGLYYISSSEKIPFVAFSIGEMGIAFMSPVPLPPSCTLQMVLQIPDNPYIKEVPCNGKVVRIEPDGGQFRIGVGITYIQPKNKMILKSFIKKFQAS